MQEQSAQPLASEQHALPKIQFTDQLLTACGLLIRDILQKLHDRQNDERAAA